MGLHTIIIKILRVLHPEESLKNSRNKRIGIGNRKRQIGLVKLKL